MLTVAARFWFVVAVVGQLLFTLYVVAFYGRAAGSGDLTQWNKVMPHGYVSGDAIGNFAVGLHLAMAVLVLGGGAIQLVPWVRRVAPVFHRWNGRIYMVAVCATSVAGLFMVWTRGTVGGMVAQVSISVNAVLILVCAAMAWRQAVARQIAAHRRWALRLFLVSSGVWFFRVGLMLWLLIHRRPVGFDPDTFQGPFLTFLGIGQYVIPLVVVEMYFWAQERGGRGTQTAMAVGLVVLTLGMAGGIFGATMGMWLPRL